MTKSRDTKTGSLFAWARGQEPVQRHEPRVTAAASLGQRLVNGIKATLDELKDRGIDRQQIADLMSAYLGEKVSLPMLNKYASQTGHEISAVRFIAFVHATNDLRNLNVLTEPLGYVAVPREAEGLLKALSLFEQEERQAAELATTRETRKIVLALARGKAGR
jgi:hypothetical protein